MAYRLFSRIEPEIKLCYDDLMKLEVRPGEVLSWKEFINSAPNQSIALDGYVGDSPKFKDKGLYLNFNHHEKVDRLATRCTAAQVLMAIRQGLFYKFSKESTIFVNDCDEDVCLSVFLLRNAHLSEVVINPVLNKLVFMEDMLDTTAGYYPFPPNLPSLEEVYWVFSPYHKFRAEGGINRGDSQEFIEVINQVEENIKALIEGKGSKVKLKTAYEVIASEGIWSMVRELDPQARLKMSSDGIRAYVSVRQISEDRWAYTLGRSSLFINFDLPKLYKALNKAEKSEGQWGGSDIVGGSPRIEGSCLPPERVVEIIKKFTLS